MSDEPPEGAEQARIVAIPVKGQQEPAAAPRFEVVQLLCSDRQVSFFPHKSKSKK
jgi:hypothetical protein